MTALLQYRARVQLHHTGVFPMIFGSASNAVPIADESLVYALPSTSLKPRGASCAGSYSLINVYLCRFPVKCTKVTKRPWYCVRYTRTFNTPWIEKCHSSILDENFLV